MRTLRTSLALAALSVLVLAGAPAASADVPKPTRVSCAPSTATLDLRAALPVVPGYCLISVHTSAPEPGTNTRGVVTYHGWTAKVRIYREGAWSTYRYVRASSLGLVSTKGTRCRTVQITPTLTATRCSTRTLTTR